MKAFDIVKTITKEMEEFGKELGFTKLFCVGKDVKVIEKAEDYRKEIIKARKKFDVVIVNGKGNLKENRRILEAFPDILLSPHAKDGKDFMTTRASGLDNVLCKIAFKNKVAIGIDFSELLESSYSQRIKILGRIIQNIRLCRKYKVNMAIFTFASSTLGMRAAKDLRAFIEVIGMNPKEAKNALSIIYEIKKRNEEKRSPEYVSEGIKIVE